MRITRLLCAGAIALALAAAAPALADTAYHSTIHADGTATEFHRGWIGDAQFHWWERRDARGRMLDRGVLSVPETSDLDDAAPTAARGPRLSRARLLRLGGRRPHEFVPPARPAPLAGSTLPR